MLGSCTFCVRRFPFWNFYCGFPWKTQKPQLQRTMDVRIMYILFKEVSFLELLLWFSCWNFWCGFPKIENWFWSKKNWRRFSLEMQLNDEPLWDRRNTFENNWKGTVCILKIQLRNTRQSALQRRNAQYAPKSFAQRKPRFTWKNEKSTLNCVFRY